jgi:hypothetical protein
MENKDWILEQLNINQDWQKRGLYTGNVKFKNGVKMELALLLDNEKCVKMIAMLQEEIVASAVNLSDLLMKSMPVQIPASTEPEKIS